MSDSSAIDNAIVAKLLADSTLTALMPDGVYWEEANAGSKRFVIVSLVDSVDEPVFGGRAYEDSLYLVKAVALSTTGADIKAAAARIDTLLDEGTLTITGYSFMTVHRESRIRITEVDDSDASIRWQHRGGHYRVQAAVA